MSYNQYYVRVDTREFEDYCQSQNLLHLFRSIDWNSKKGDSFLYSVTMHDDEALRMKLTFQSISMSKIYKQLKELV